MRAFHNQAVMKQFIYKNILLRKSGTYYSPSILCEKTIVGTNKERALTMTNQLSKHKGEHR